MFFSQYTAPPRPCDRRQEVSVVEWHWLAANSNPLPAREERRNIENVSLNTLWHYLQWRLMSRFGGQ